MLSSQLPSAMAHFQRCFLCEHRCGANRVAGERGPCKAGVEARVFRHRVEYGEELELIPSHLFYLSGCDLRCAFCIAEANAFDPSRGDKLTAEFLQPAIDWGRQQGAKNIQWVGGEPTIHLPRILEVMSRCHELPPVVWKSDFYGTPEALDLLNGVVDTYVADFKFGNDECARRIASVDRYVETVTRNLCHAQRQGNLIVRHLLLPGHEECCYKPIVYWLRSNLPTVKFSIRGGYLPRWRAGHFRELSARLAPNSLARAESLARDLELNVIE